MAEPFEILSGEMKAAVEEDMRAVLNFDKSFGDPFYGMMHYHMGWVDESLEAIHSSGGKHVRPLLCLLTCQAAGGNWEQAVPAASALELLHNFTLIHDDIQDSSPTRRGRATLWQIWGIEQAINSGDAMFALSHLAMSRLIDRGVAAEVVVQALRRLDETCILLTEGQYADMDFESRPQVAVEEYLAMIEGKTAALIALSTELGALIADCDPATVDHYAAFGRDLGFAFQVRDDILGIWGDERLIGKSASTDIATRKKSLPVLFGLSGSEELRGLYAQYDSGEDFVDCAVKLLDQVGALDFSKRHEQDYSESALNHLEEANPHGQAGAALRQLTANLLNRRS